MKLYLTILPCIALATSLMPASLLASLQEHINTCAKLQPAAVRLHCYDNISTPKQAMQEPSYVTPPKEFMSSELRIKRNKSEYTLSIADFVSLIKHAILEDGKRVTVLGWNRHQQSFFLQINMQETITVSFTHIKTKTENFSLLHPVSINNDTVEPSVFIITIASMSPD